MVKASLLNFLPFAAPGADSYSSETEDAGSFPQPGAAG